MIENVCNSFKSYSLSRISTYLGIYIFRNSRVTCTQSAKSEKELN